MARHRKVGRAFQAGDTAGIEAWLHGTTQRTPSSVAWLEECEVREGVCGESNSRACQARPATPSSCLSCGYVFPIHPHFVGQLLENAALPWLCSEDLKEGGLCSPCTSAGPEARVTTLGLGLVRAAITSEKTLMGKWDTTASRLPTKCGPWNTAVLKPEGLSVWLFFFLQHVLYIKLHCVNVFLCMYQVLNSIVCNIYVTYFTRASSEAC